MQDALKAATDVVTTDEVTTQDPALPMQRLEIPDFAANSNEQPTQAETREAAAAELFELSDEIARLTAIFEGKKAAAVTLFGEGTTETFAGLGTVKVIAATQQRTSNTLTSKFDEKAYLNASSALRSQLEKLGIVSVGYGTIGAVRAHVRLTKTAAKKAS